MPIEVHKNIEPAGELGIWKIEEDESFFLQQLHLTVEEQQQLAAIKGRKRIEWLAVRHLLHQMSGREIRGAVLKDEFGKPHLENSDWHISISHSHEMAAAIAAPAPVGVDIQFLVEKIARIAHKFMRPEEMESLEAASALEHLHVYWGAKEALYKAYGRKKLDFKEHIFIRPFSFSLKTGGCTGSVKKGKSQKHFSIFYEKKGDFILVWAVEKRNV